MITQRIGMDFTRFPVIILLLGIVLTSCQTPGEVDLGQFDESMAYFQFVMKNDDFFTSEEDILNDPEENFIGKGLPSSTESVLPFIVRRTIRSIERSFSYEFEGENVAIVTMTRTISGTLFIRDFRWQGGVGTLIRKEFTETAVRRARFERVARTGIAENDWRLVAVSLLEGGTPERRFDITNLTLDFRTGRSYEYDNPLDLFISVRPDERNVPVVQLNDIRNRGYKIEVVIQSTHRSPELLYLRHGGGLSGPRGGNGYMRRAQIPLAYETEENGVYTRTYLLEWTPWVELHGTVRVGENMVRGRFSNIVEAIAYDTIRDQDAVVETNYWGVPFIIE